MTFLESSSLVKIKDSLGAYTFSSLQKWTFKNNENLIKCFCFSFNSCLYQQTFLTKLIRVLHPKLDLASSWIVSHLVYYLKCSFLKSHEFFLLNMHYQYIQYIQTWHYSEVKEWLKLNKLLTYMLCLLDMHVTLKIVNCSLIIVKSSGYRFKLWNSFLLYNHVCDCTNFDIACFSNIEPWFSRHLGQLVQFNFFILAIGWLLYE